MGWGVEASACEADICNAGSLLPEGGTIPANTPALRWDVGDEGDMPDEAKARTMIVLQRDGMDVPYTLEREGETVFRVVPTEPWQEGALYVFRADNPCEYDGPSVLSSAFRVGPAAPMPRGLGITVVEGEGQGVLRMGSISGSCFRDEDAVWADVAVRLTEDAQPWAAMMDFDALVDGEPWMYDPNINGLPPRGRGYLGRGKERVYVRCEERSRGFEGVGAGSHRVGFAASVYGQTTTLTSRPVPLKIDCDRGVVAALRDVRKPSADGSSEGPHPQFGPDPYPALWGCRVGGSPGWALLLLVLGWRRQSGIQAAMVVRNT